jgi:hypothetical protein
MIDQGDLIRYTSPQDHADHDDVAVVLEVNTLLNQTLVHWTSEATPKRMRTDALTSTSCFEIIKKKESDNE